jgi:hypothetical protein
MVMKRFHNKVGIWHNLLYRYRLYKVRRPPHVGVYWS